MECLDNDPRQRPTAEQLVSRLEGMSVEVQCPQDHIAKLQLIGQLRQIEVRLMSIIIWNEFIAEQAPHILIRG